MMLRARSVRLKHALAVAITLLAAALTAIVSYTLGRAGVTRVETEIGGRLATLADQMQDKLDRGLFERYREITNAASLLPLFETAPSPDARERLLEQLRATFGEYAWIGYVDRTGKVLSATDGLNVGVDMSGAATFRSALMAPVVGEVHTAPLALPDPRSADIGQGRFVDIAAPVVDPDGDTVGVLIAHLSWNWAEEIKDSLFGSDEPRPGVEVLVLGPTGVVLMGPPEYANRLLKLPSVTAAQRNVNRASVETWPDGRRYVTGYAKSDGYRSFPGLGWIVLVREDADLALLPATNLQRQVVALALASILAAVLAAWFLADRLAAPLLNLSRAAERVRRGENIEIPNVSTYAEAEVLSESLRSLVAELQSRQDKLSKLNASLEDEVAVRTSELAEQNSALAAAKEAAEQATAAKSRFLAAASHDLRQPLHALILFARALSRRVQSDEAQRLVRQMEEALASLRTMFDALLNISRLDAGLVSPQMVTFDIGQHIEKISAGFRAEANARGLEFRMRTTRASVTTDAAILESMVRNLVPNALKFTKAGGVLLSTRRRGNRIAIEIYDTGPGIPAADADTIFQEFHRTRHQAVGPNDGLGLGLSIVRRYARLLGVDVTMRARPGHGTCFRLVLPATDPVPAPLLEAADPPTARAPARILVLDDDSLIVAALVRELSDHGHAVQGFAVTSAAEAVLRSGAPFDVVIADHDLGGAETGTAFVARMETVLGRPVPSLILSGATDAGTLSMLTRTGRPWLTKPADSRAITEAIAKLTHPSGTSSRQTADATA